MNILILKNSSPCWIKYGICLFVIVVTGCTERPVPEVITLDASEAKMLAEQIRGQVSVTVDEALELTLWAPDTLVRDPSAVAMDNHGKLYFTSAHRINNSEFDIRGHPDWMTASIGFQSVEDRRKFLRDTFAIDRSHLNTWLEDLNGDSIHDWRDLTVEKEEIWWLEDTDDDGLADKSQLYIRDFHEEISDLANGIHVDEDGVFIAVGPDLWRTLDKNNDGIADSKTSISHGYAVHIGFGAHGMSGVTRGPDGRIWWGIGDIGMNVVDKEGNHWKYPNQGVIVRCEPDGSGFEVFAAGLRNTHEFVFDQYGNLITEDNDGDHAGERERLVYITNGSDGGWRINWQFGKYTDPDNNDYKVWMDEKLHIPRWEGQAAYITPPIVNYVNGPTGMLFNPGTALGPEWANHFFIVEFRGSPANSPIHAFTLEPEGASFRLATTKEVVRGLLPTGLDFGPDGALYFGDWLEGWDAKNRGRIWKLDIPGGAQTAIRLEVKQLLAEDFKGYSPDELGSLLRHVDMRIRQKAQFELVRRGHDGKEKLLSSVAQEEHQLARIHGIWGIGQLARKNIDEASALVPYLRDGDPEIQAQAVKIIGDVRYAGASEQLIGLLDHPSLRVQFFAAEALGRTAATSAVEPILAMLEANDDRDAWLRHGGVMALARIGQADPLISLSTHPSRALRIAAVVALRRMQHPGVAEFLDDQDEYIVTEAARAINDDFSIEEALPKLAETLSVDRFSEEPLIRRAINANLRIGGEAQLERLVNYSLNKKAPVAMRSEALACLSTWPKPSVHDRVDGRYRGQITRDPGPVVAALKPHLSTLLVEQDKNIRMSAVVAINRLKLGDMSAELVNRLKKDRESEVRSASLLALYKTGYERMDQALETALSDASAEVRSAALSILPNISSSGINRAQLLSGILTKGTVPEKQAALTALGNLGDEESAQVLNEHMDKFLDGRTDPATHLELLKAMEGHGSQILANKLSAYQEQISRDDPMAAYRALLYGGNLVRGRNIFFQNASAQCVRCHAIFTYGGDAGPTLDGVGSSLDRETILESLIRPNARIAPGYETISVFTKMEDSFTGMVKSEDENELILLLEDGSTETIVKSDILDRLNAASSMPTVENVLDDHQIRDLVEFLANLKRASS